MYIKIKLIQFLQNDSESQQCSCFSWRKGETFRWEAGKDRKYQPLLFSFQYFLLYNLAKNLNMEKSMVQELNRLSSSQFIGNRSTFITTTLNDGDYQLKKSRIQNLPSYRKEDLSDKLPFVTVFQTIEIQRLSTEIETLRVALKDAERQGFNASNYEVQIRQLTEKCFSYDQERQQYRQEVDKLNMICQKLYSELENLKNRYADIDPTIQEKYRLEKDRARHLQEEIQKWKARVHALQVSKNRELEDMRLMMESQRKSMLDRQIKQLTLKYNSERQLLENEIRKLREAHDSKQTEIHKLSSHISRLEIMNEEMRQYEATIEEYENKFAMISQETIRLNDLLRHKSEQIERISAKEQKLLRRIRELESLLAEAENQNKAIQKYQKEIQDWKIKCSQVENQSRKYQRELDELPKMQQLLRDVNRQSDQLKENQRQKIMEVQLWKQKCQQLEQVQKERQLFQKKQIPAFESKIQQLNNENDRLNNVLRTRVGELENWKNKNIEMEKTINHYIIIEKEKKNLENQLNSQVRNNQDLKNSLKYLQDKTKKMGDLERELASQEQEKAKFIQELQRLNSAVRGLNFQKENLQKKNENLEKSLENFRNIEEELRFHKQKEINFTKEIDRINGIINQKIRQIQSLKQYFFKIQKSMEHYKSLEKKLISSVSQTQKLIQDLDQSRKQASFYQEKLMVSQSNINNLKNEIFTLSQEKDQTIRLINRKSQQLEGVLAENQEIKTQNQNLRKVQSMYREVQDKYKLIEQKCNDQEKRLSKQQSKSLQLNNSLEQANNELNKIRRQGMLSPQFKEELYNLKVQCQKKQRDFRSLQERYYAIESLLRKLKSTISQNEQMNKRNNQKWLNVSSKLDITTNYLKKMFDMQNQIYKLKEENLNLQSKTRIMNFQMEAENMKKSFMGSNVNGMSNLQVGGGGDLRYRKVESTFYFDNSDVKGSSNKIERTALEPLSFRQNRSIYKFDLT